MGIAQLALAHDISIGIVVQFTVEWACLEIAGRETCEIWHP
jgi:hypothetical protein